MPLTVAPPIRRTGVADRSGASDDAILDAVGSAFTVNSVTNEYVQSVQLASNATLSLLAGTFDASEGTGAGGNAGIILVDAGATMEVGAQIRGQVIMPLSSTLL